MTATLLVLYGPPTDPAAFGAHYTGTHLGLVKAITGLESARSSAGPVATPEGPAPYHQVSTYTFGSMASLQEAMGSPAAAAAGEDLANFASGGATMLVFEDHEV